MVALVVGLAPETAAMTALTAKTPEYPLADKAKGAQHGHLENQLGKYILAAAAAEMTDAEELVPDMVDRQEAKAEMQPDMAAEVVVVQQPQ